MINVIIAGILGGGFMGFMEFLIKRKDAKHDKSDEIIKRLDHIEGRIDSIDAKADEREAIACRIRILLFMDELLEGRRKRKDSYDQCMQDIVFYENYCAAEEHKDFKNGQTEMTVEYIKHNYAERLEKNDFL